MKQFEAHLKVIGGKMEWRNPAYVEHQLTNFEGCEGVLTIKKKWSKRSLSQNALYWVWLDEISKHTGHTDEELHIVFRGLFGPKKQVTIASKPYTIPKSTTEYTKGEFVEYMMRIEAEAGTMRITLPHPEDLQNTAVLLNQ